MEKDLSITHQELLKAIDLRKPRWFLAHDHVPFARSLLRALGYKDAGRRARLTLEKKDVISDLRVIDLYEPASAVSSAARRRSRRRARVLYLPPYSDDLNPMEDVWSKLKQQLRSAKARTFDSLIDAMADGLRSVNASDLLGFFRHRTVRSMVH